MIFVDANLLLRALTRPTSSAVRSDQAVAAEFLRDADLGRVEFTTSDAVLAEVAYVLTAKTHYDLTVDKATGLLSTVIRLRGFRHGSKRTLLRSLEIWSDNPRIGFVDALTAAYAQAPDMMLATFDSDFDAFPEIDRWDPGVTD